MSEKLRCPWCEKDELYRNYHDKEWGRPVFNDKKLFENLILDAFQAGLSWYTILSKRENFRKAFDDFDLEKIIRYDKKKIEALMKDAGIVRNRMKIESTIKNAMAFKEIQNEFGSFSDYIWSFVDFKPIDNRIKSMKEIPTHTQLSDTISKDLKRRGFKFVGTTIVYAFLQAVGIVNDHLEECFVRKEMNK